MSAFGAMVEYTILTFKFTPQQGSMLGLIFCTAFNTVLRAGALYGVVWVVCKAVKDSGLL